MTKCSFKRPFVLDVGDQQSGRERPRVQGAGSGNAPNTGVAHAPAATLHMLRPATLTAQNAVSVTRGCGVRQRAKEGVAHAPAASPAAAKAATRTAQNAVHLASAIAPRSSQIMS